LFGLEKDNGAGISEIEMGWDFKALPLGRPKKTK